MLYRHEAIRPYPLHAFRSILGQSSDGPGQRLRIL